MQTTSDLAPYLTNYETRIQVMTYALDGLQEGTNKIEMLLGRGWYMGLFGLDLKRDHYGSRMAAIGEIHILQNSVRNQVRSPRQAYGALPAPAGSPSQVPAG